MRFYPRNDQSRRDALAGPGHVANKSQPDAAAAYDRLLRYDYALVNSNILAAYGGTK